MPYLNRWIRPCTQPNNDSAQYIDYIAPRVGAVLSMLDSEDYWSTNFPDEDPLVMTYQWRRDGVNIGGATSSSYTLTTDDIGTTVDVIVTATNHCGSSASAASADQVTDITIANRYWVGGTGTWNTSSEAHWSLTTGGAGGASMPDIADNVYFDLGSGGGTISIANITTCRCKDFDTTGFIGTIGATGAQGTINMRGSMTLGTGTTLDTSASPLLQFAFYANSGNYTITTNGRDMRDCYMDSINLTTSSTATWTIHGTFGVTASTKGGLGIRTGTLDLNNQIINVGTLSMTDTGFAANDATILAGTSTINMTRSGAALIGVDFSATSNFDYGTSTINYIAAGANRLLRGGGNEFYNVNFLATTSANSQFIYGSNTFNNLDVNNGLTGSSNTTSTSFEGGTTQTINGTFAGNGRATKLSTLTRHGSGNAIISSTLGAALDYMSINHMTGAGGGTFSATHSTDGGSNVNWTITP